MKPGSVSIPLRIRFARVLLAVVLPVVLLPPLVLSALAARIARAINSRKGKRPRLLWAGAPLLSLKTASAAMTTAGYQSRTVANAIYRTMKPGDFDLQLEFGGRLPFGLNMLAYSFRASMHFARAMFTADILHTFFNGALLGRTPLASAEFWLWTLSGGRLVVMPYGTDAFVYRRLPDRAWARALQVSYPRTEEDDLKAERDVERGCRLADAVVGCIVHDVCLPRVDYRPILWYPFDPALKPSYPTPSRPVRVVHATNHAAVKGSDAVIRAMQALRDDGVDIELMLLERVSHEEAIAALAGADIVVDQLLFGYALAALEAMALGKVVITGVDDDPIYESYRQRGLLSDSPLINANPATIQSVLRHLVDRREDLNSIGRRCRAYVERVHGPAQTVELFEEIYASFGY